MISRQHFKILYTEEGFDGPMSELLGLVPNEITNQMNLKLTKLVSCCEIKLALK